MEAVTKAVVEREMSAFAKHFTVLRKTLDAISGQVRYAWSNPGLITDEENTPAS